MRLGSPSGTSLPSSCPRYPVGYWGWSYINCDSCSRCQSHSTQIHVNTYQTRYSSFVTSCCVQNLACIRALHEVINGFFFIYLVRLQYDSILKSIYNVLISISSSEPGHGKMCLMSYANNKGADQPAHPRILISAFVVRCLDSIISLNSIAKILRL